MEQLALFPEAGQSRGLPTQYLEYFPKFIEPFAGQRSLEHFIAHTPWTQQIRTMYTKEVVTPRLTAWYGDPTSYDYQSLIRSVPLTWTPELLMIKDLVEPLAGVEFNSVLLNYYRNGNDSVAWHSDKEEVLGKDPIIASVSFGQVRSFDIRNKQDHQEHYSVKLEHGSFLLMKAGLQENWEHRIAKSSRPMGPRVNLTFRVVK
ncbi:alpha-ketoglutarate-dependent dioxygenase AlkB [Mucilaginibacter daejeonensis]|uniref:alpha-ketoglutarate-dependent dioxygenase AlkB family protein n=1 Tax=Mucilaginibacter daejeonensis TaxID=398049 RepID=UPI001D175584|nr:alpha-ketoglutarate-dependent dioxygenase AlkB [Mucilaginibacter daejeonensis]UEG54195.1 alpha-ketoglutarate-dependent dioxygenase AlkB [Mucilaginibacter daejeonensis]